MRKKTSKKIIVAILLVTMLSQTLYSAAASIFGIRAQSYAYADDEFTEDVEPGEMVDESTQDDGSGETAEASEEYTEEEETTEDGEESEVADDSEYTEEEADEEEVREVPDISLRISYVDEDGSGIKDTEDYDIDPDFFYIFKYEAPKIEGYDYNKTTIDIDDSDTNITAVYSEDVDGIQVYSVTTDNDIDDKDFDDISWTELTEDSVIVMHYDTVEEETVEEETEVSENDAKAEEPTKRVYEYEDSRVYAKATLERADAIPDDAVFVVKDVTGSTDANDAVEKADEATESDLDKETARVYDIHFENDELGEIEPEEGSVKIEIRFKRSIIKPEADTSEERNISVVHVDDAGKATEVSADVSDTASGVSNIEFDTDSLSYYVVASEVSTATTAAEALAKGASLVPMVSKVSINGNDIPNNAADYQLPQNSSVYELGVTFKESGANQFGPIMYYQLPAGMKPENTDPVESSLNLEGSAGDDGKALSGSIPFVYHIETDENGDCYLIVEFDTRNGSNYEYLDAASNASFNIGVKVKMMLPRSGSPAPICLPERSL